MEDEKNGDEGNRDWYQQLWDSISTPEEVLEEQNNPENEDHKLPTVPEEKTDAPAPEQASEGAPAPAQEQAPAPAN